MAKKAVLIGINRYRIPGADLRGCVNDVKNMRQVLIDLYGFKAGDIATLTDLAASKTAMQAAISKLVAGGRAGDVLLLHYSGHGANVPDANGDEADHRDEILCPTDLDWKNPLDDDWLRVTFNKLRPGVSFTAIMDCCHSGSNTRAFWPPDAPSIPRYLPNPWDLVAAESGRKLRGTVRRSLRTAPGPARARTDVVNADIGELLITGCRDTQTSADAHIGGSFNGALTYNLASVLRDARGAISYLDLHRRTVEGLRKGRFDQVPQLEGRRASFARAFLSPTP